MKKRVFFWLWLYLCLFRLNKGVMDMGAYSSAPTAKQHISIFPSWLVNNCNSMKY